MQPSTQPITLTRRVRRRGESIYSKRLDLRAKTGSAIGPTIRLGRHSRKPPEGDEMNRPEPMHGLNHPRNSAISTKHSCD
jgi:hypothetical protein